LCVYDVDDSGYWGRGGLFTALELRSDEPRKQYELAGDMKGDKPFLFAETSLIQALSLQTFHTDAGISSHSSLCCLQTDFSLNCQN